MNSYLIIGASIKNRLQEIKKIIANYLPINSIVFQNQTNEIKISSNHPDLFIVNASPSIKISQIRQIKSILSQKPFQAKVKIIILPEAEKMTVPAQNAFLKTLEEPPQNSLLILSCQNEKQLLETIISRCQLIKLSSKTAVKIDSQTLNDGYLILKKLFQAGAGERLKLIEPYLKNKEEAIEFLKTTIIILRKMAVKTKKDSLLSPSTTILSIQSFQKTLILLQQTNVNLKLALNNLVLELKQL